ncbi:MAG: hypothetical protein JRE23_12730 [Deltaproteobacteria bacterium]|nr:hypothetical protein [Deltaproteobacteria bacterium]
MGSKIENNDLRLAEERRKLLKKGVKLVTNQLRNIIADSEDVFVSFLSYNKRNQLFEPIDLINTNPLFEKSKEFQRQGGKRSFYYAREAIIQNVALGYNVLGKDCPWHDEIKKIARNHAIRSVVSTSVILDNEPVGVINFFYTRPLTKQTRETTQLSLNCQMTAFSLSQSIEKIRSNEQLMELLKIAQGTVNLLAEEIPKSLEEIEHGRKRLKGLLTNKEILSSLTRLSDLTPTSEK